MSRGRNGHTEEDDEDLLLDLMDWLGSPEEGGRPAEPPPPIQTYRRAEAPVATPSQPRVTPQVQPTVDSEEDELLASIPAVPDYYRKQTEARKVEERLKKIMRTGKDTFR